jgi:hypothetical protein
MKNQTPTTIDYEKGFNGRSNYWIDSMLNCLDPVDLVSGLLEWLIAL